MYLPQRLIRQNLEPNLAGNWLVGWLIGIFKDVLPYSQLLGTLYNSVCCLFLLRSYCLTVFKYASTLLRITGYWN